MRQYTNMSWPDDPYGTGQLYRRTVPLLAAFAPVWVDDGSRALPVAYAVVYMRLHRTRALLLEDGFAFGFRAVVLDDEDDVEPLVQTFDLDLLQARRHAVILAGYSFLDDLYCMGGAATAVPRGIHAVQEAWPRRDQDERGTARMVDVSGSEPATIDALRQLCIRSKIGPGTAGHGLARPSAIGKRWASLDEPASPRWLAAAATEKALMIGLIAGRSEERYSWEATVDIGACLSAQTRDFDQDTFV
jgi:hypothetical protein